MAIEIRALTPAEEETTYHEVAALFAGMYQYMDSIGLVQQLVPEGEFAWIQAIQKMLGKLHQVVVAFDEGQAIGFAAGNVRLLPNYLGSKKIGYVSHVYVADAYKQQQLGRRLAEGLMTWFQEKEVAYVELEVLRHNEGALRFWEKLGFGTDSIRMIRPS